MLPLGPYRRGEGHRRTVDAARS